MPSFRANLLHGSLETCSANWFLHCFFWSFTQHQDLWTVFSNGTNKQGLCVYLEWGEGWRAGEYRREGRRGKKDMGEGEWREVGDEGVKVVGVILLLEPVALTLTVAWKPNQSVSIHTESGFMWADSRTGLYDRALASHGHSLFLTPLTARFACNDFHLFKFLCLFLMYA